MGSIEYLDDSDWSIDPEDEPSHWLAVLIGVIVLGIFLIVANREIQVPPLVVNFPPAGVTFQPSLTIDPLRAKQMNCIWTNGTYTRPNWEDPECSPESAKKKGWY